MTTKTKKTSEAPEDADDWAGIDGSELLGDWHPAWCTDACDPVTIHIGEERKIPLSLEEPWRGRGSSGREIWQARTLSMELIMDRRGAVEPIYEFSAGMGTCFKMTEGPRSDGRGPLTVGRSDLVEAADMPQLADWVRTHSHGEVDRERDGLLRVLGRSAETSEASDPVTRQALELADRLDVLRCVALADQVRSIAQKPDDLAWWLVGCHGLLVAAAKGPEVLSELLELTSVQFVLECSHCGNTAPMNQSGSWGQRDGKLVCPDCRQGIEP